jgi:hypothetical protein
MLIYINDFFSHVKIILIPDQECLPSVVDYKAIVRIAKMRFTLVNA